MASDFENEQASYAASGATNVSSEGKTLGDVGCGSAFVSHVDESIVDGNDMELCVSKESSVKATLSDEPVQEKFLTEEESPDVELGNFFSEDGPLNEGLSLEAHKLQQKIKMREMLSDKNLEKLVGIWKKVLYMLQLLVKIRFVFSCLKYVGKSY